MQLLFRLFLNKLFYRKISPELLGTEADLRREKPQRENRWKSKIGVGFSHSIFVPFNLLVVPCTYGANISIGHQIKLKICGPFPRESAGKKLTQITAEKPADRLVDHPAFGRQACLDKAIPVYRRQTLCALASLRELIFLNVRRGGRISIFVAQRRRDAKGNRKQSFAS